MTPAVASCPTLDCHGRQVSQNDHRTGRRLRLPRIHPEGSDRLPFSCFRLQDHRFTVRGRSPRAVSGGPSTGRTQGSGGTLPVASRASPSAVRWCLCGVEAPASCASRLLQPHVSKSRSCFSPWDRFTTGRPNRMELATCSRGSLAAVRKTGKGRGPFTPRLQIGGFSGPCL
jgi:hypothetical protein